MKRREFLIGGSALLGLPLVGCVTPGGSKPPAPTSTQVVDVHCHIFNASDLPEVRFIRIVFLHHYPEQGVKALLDIEDPDVLDALIAFILVVFDQCGAPSARDEIEVLDGGRAKAKYADDAVNENAVIDAMAAFVKSQKFRIEGVPPEGLDKLRRALLRAGNATEAAAKKSQLSDVEAREIAAKALRSDFDIGVILRWIRLFTRYRHVLADKLAAHHARQGFAPMFLAPATVDFDSWLGQWVDKSPMPEQITVMGRIARRKNGPAVHGYVGFDPLRQVLFEEGLRHDYDPLKEVARAIDEEGFVGAKVYPPMGFRAIDNDGDVCRLYPDTPTFAELLARLPNDPAPADCSPQPKDGSRALSKRLDDAMRRLFDLCASRHACVIAHANNSNGANEDYGEFADPGFWLPVFAKWPSLRVCLAHFGSFNSRSAAAASGTVFPDSSWEWAFGNYLKEHPSAPVYMDISYLNEIFGKSQEELAAYTATLRKWLATFDPECQHLMFGTDWVMLGIDPSYPSYTSSVYNYFRDEVGLDEMRLQRLLSGNAAAFLGLHKGDAVRTRLEGFYRRHGLPAGRLPAFPS